jgi:hypothetical protein
VHTVAAPQLFADCPGEVLISFNPTLHQVVVLHHKASPVPMLITCSTLAIQEAPDVVGILQKFHAAPCKTMPAPGSAHEVRAALTPVLFWNTVEIVLPSHCTILGPDSLLTCLMAAC